MGVLLHVQTAFWFVAGLLGRNMNDGQARTVSDVRTLDELVTLSGRLPATCTTFICSEGGTESESWLHRRMILLRSFDLFSSPPLDQRHAPLTEPGLTVLRTAPELRKT